jgi:Mrp family chromosome partitioning ATPase
LNNSVSGIASKEVTISLLTSEVENASKEYKEALDRFNTERNKSLVAASPLRLVVVGQPNGYPERSKRVVFIAFAGLASLIICVAAIVTLELIDLRLKNPGQFRRLASLELAGTLNQINSKRLNLDYLFNTQTKDRELSAFKHSLRNLRFMLESTNAQTFLVTSTKIGEGKSFIILCLAYSLSLVKKKILIIDTNFKHNSLTQELLAISSDHKKLESGFYIRGLIGKGNPDEIPEDDFVTSIISPTSHQGINVIGNSGGDKSPSEIFAGRDFKKMLNKLKERYDYIFLEGAALNHFSDTKELVEYVDKVIPVFNAESTLRQIDQESLGYLKSLNGKLVGSILNGIALGELKI